MVWAIAFFTICFGLIFTAPLFAYGNSIDPDTNCIVHVEAKNVIEHELFDDFGKASVFAAEHDGTVWEWKNTPGKYVVEYHVTEAVANLIDDCKS